MKKRKSAATAPPESEAAPPGAPETARSASAAQPSAVSAVSTSEGAAPGNGVPAAEDPSPAGEGTWETSTWEGPTQVDLAALEAGEAEILQSVDLDDPRIAPDAGGSGGGAATERYDAWASIEPDGEPRESLESAAAPGEDDVSAEGAAENAEVSVDGAAEEAPGAGGPEVLGDGDGDGVGDEAALPTDASRLESVLESLLFATDRALAVSDLKRLLGERDGKRLTQALEALRDRRADSGIQLVSVAGGWQLRTHPANGEWVAKLVAGRPQRLSRAMMETLAIVAYRQPITRPEIDEIRGVDCGPVLRTLLDRGLVRVIGKKEEVGRPILYGTTPEFLKTFSLRDLTDLPTLREFHELGAAERAEVDATLPGPGDVAAAAAAGEAGDAASPAGAASPSGALRPTTVELPNVDPDEEEALLEELEQATQAAGRATASALEPKPPEGGDGHAQPAADAASPSHGGEG